MQVGGQNHYSQEPLWWSMPQNPWLDNPSPTFGGLQIDWKEEKEFYIKKKKKTDFESHDLPLW